MTVAPVVSIDVVQAVIDYLAPFVGVVDSRVPNPRPSEFVKVVDGGTSRSDVVVDESLVSVECWARSELRANELGRIVQALLIDWEGAVSGATVVYAVRCSGPRWYPDPATDLPRVQLTANITHRASLYLSTTSSGADQVTITVSDTAPDYATAITQ